MIMKVRSFLRFLYETMINRRPSDIRYRGIIDKAVQIAHCSTL